MGAESIRPFRTMRRLIELRQPIVQSLAADASLADAARLMTGAQIEALVVLDGESLVGVLSRSDFAKLAAGRLQWRDCRMGEAMRPTSAHADLDTTVPQALTIMDKNGLDHLPVMADGRVVGIFSRTALLEELVWHYGEVIREMQLREQIMHRQGVYSC